MIAFVGLLAVFFAAWNFFTERNADLVQSLRRDLEISSGIELTLLDLSGDSVLLLAFQDDARHPYRLLIAHFNRTVDLWHVAVEYSENPDGEYSKTFSNRPTANEIESFKREFSWTK